MEIEARKSNIGGESDLYRDAKEIFMAVPPET